MPTIHDFSRTIQQAEQRGGYLDVNRQGALEIKGTGFFGKIASWFRTAADVARTNERVMHAFVDALRQRYGQDFADESISQLRNTPLSSRLVAQVIQSGGEHQEMVRALNQVKVNELATKTETFANLFRDVAAERGCTISLEEFNTESLLDGIRKGIEQNKHVVSTEEAYNIARSAIEHFLKEIYGLFSGFHNDLEEALSILNQTHSRENLIEVSIQTMSDEVEGRNFLREHLDDSKFCKERFTGIESHPTDSRKFIATFGEDRITFSNRGGGVEIRGSILKQKLTGYSYRNLRELIEQDYLTSRDNMLLYACGPVITPFAHRIKQMEALPQDLKNKLAMQIMDRPIGNTTIGEAFGKNILEIINT